MVTSSESSTSPRNSKSGWPAFASRSLMPILLLFLPGMAWGFSDNIVLPGGHRPDTAMEVLFYASLGVVFGATMCAVLMAFDGVTRTEPAACSRCVWLTHATTPPSHGPSSATHRASFSLSTPCW